MGLRNFVQFRGCPFFCFLIYCFHAASRLNTFIFHAKIWIFLLDFRKYSNWLSINYDMDARVLTKSWDRYGFGSNYVASSVWICVSIPILIYAILFILIF
jgi:hypothetical protein